MEKLLSILDNKNPRIYLERSGPATCARLANAALASGRTSILVCIGKDDFYEASSLARLFNPQLSAAEYPAGQPAWERPLLLMPAMRNPADREAWCARISCLYALAMGKPACVVAAMRGLMARYMPKSFFEKNTLDLAANAEYSPEIIIDQAVEWGFERVQMVTRPGEMAQRGDILDIFAPGYSRPARIEFFGDNIESIRIFDPESQRSLQELVELTILPASPVLQDPGTLESVRNRLKNLQKEGKLSENEAYSLKKSLEEGEKGILPGMAFADSSFIEAWLPLDTLWILPGEIESGEAMQSARDALKEEIEAESANIQQRAALALRPRAKPAPWNSFQCVFSEPLRIGVEEKGINMPERELHQFTDLFTKPEDTDRPWQAFVRAFHKWQGDKNRIVLSFATERGRKKFLKLAEPDGITPNLRFSLDSKGTFALISPYHAGAELAWDDSLVLGEDIIYPKADRRERRSSRVFKGLDSFENLKNGDLLVHRDYGIGRFAGLHHLDINRVANDYLLLEYSGNDKLYIPVDRLALVQSFKGQEGLEPPLDRLGTQAWVNGKEKVRKAIEKIAADLVEMYAYRKVAKSFRYGPPDELYREFEATFGFEETPDQARAIQDVLDDMERVEPMDRLVCGDVGFGKTEVALRAAFRAASEGRQVALLCPTTVLAEQHYQTFRSRLAGFPINVGLLSRFVPRARQKETLKACENGQIDILIGTHRLLSNDVKLPNLALLILDEEQRFGVRHKEKLKSLKKNVDALTLTATPIPRTLQLSMSGIRDLSIIETAPAERKPVASALVTRDDDTLRKVIEREIAREGQVFWVYNRVNNLESVAEYVKKLVPTARVGMAHGQMGETELETTMRKFWHGELDVLVSTSIVESGLDFPRANTLVVDQAQMFGLGQLYQLRGRVGRSDRQAYAFFVVPDTRKLTEVAEERLRIILDMDYLGAGFQVAMEDLRLRGAGNILGEAQSGHMSRVGLDMYLEMLEEAVAKLKGQPREETMETEINLSVPAHIPATYIEDGRERLRFYKSLTSAQDATAREEIALGMRDRFGHFPAEVNNFLSLLDFKQFLGQIQVEKADISSTGINLVWRNGQTAMRPDEIVRLAAQNPQISIIPPASLRLPMSGASLDESLRAARAWLEKARDVESQTVAQQ